MYWFNDDGNSVFVEEEMVVLFYHPIYGWYVYNIYDTADPLEFWATEETWNVDANPPSFLTNRRGEKIFVGDRVVTFRSSGSTLMFNSVTRQNEIVFGTEALRVTEVFDDPDYNFMTLKIDDARVFHTVQPGYFTPLCETCDGAGIDDNDNECPACDGTGTPKRNMP